MKVQIRSARICFGIAAAALLAGCDGPTNTSQEELKVDTGSGIQGTITLGPICPVQRWPTDCPDQPLQATLSLQDENGNEIARVESGLDGFYSIVLDPGSFVLVAEPVTDNSAPAAPGQVGWPAPPAAVAVTVNPDVWARVDLSYDTGIR